MGRRARVLLATTALILLPLAAATKRPADPAVAVSAADSAAGILVMGGAYAGGLELGGHTFARGGRGGFVAAQARDGRISWARALASAKTVDVKSIVVRANGETAAGGRVGPAPVDFGGGPTAPQGRSDGFVARYGGRGEPLWSRRLAPADGSADVRALAFTPEGDLVVAGCFTGARFALGAEPLVNAHTPGSGSRYPPMAAVPPPQDWEIADGFVARLRGSDGTTQWSRRLGAASSDCVDALAVDAAGAVYASLMLFGAAVGEPAALASPDSKRAIVRLAGPTGALRWSQVLRPTGASRIEAKTLLADAGLIYLAGSFEGGFETGKMAVGPARGGYVGAFEARGGEIVWIRSLEAQYGVFDPRLALGPGETLVVAAVVVGPMELLPAVKLAQSKDTYSTALIGLSRSNGGAPLWIRALGARGPTRPLLSAIGRWDTGEIWWTGGLKGKLAVRTVPAR